MSMHSLKSKRRHPDADRQTYTVAHITFELCNRRENGQTFALIAGDAVHAKDRRPLFTGHVKTGMADELRALADAVEQMEPHT